MILVVDLAVCFDPPRKADLSDPRGGGLLKLLNAWEVSHNDPDLNDETASVAPAYCNHGFAEGDV
jgi:hypothetical protein